MMNRPKFTLPVTRRYYASDSSNESPGTSQTESASPDKPQSEPTNTNTNTDNANADTTASTSTTQDTTTTTTNRPNRPNPFSRPQVNLEAEVESVLKQLDRSNRQTAQTTDTMRRTREEEKDSPASKPFTGRSFPNFGLKDGLDVSKAAGSSIDTTSSRLARQGLSQGGAGAGDAKKNNFKRTTPATPVNVAVSPARSPGRAGVKLGTTLGRQVQVDPARALDVNAALRVLGANCALNKVRGQANAQRFHVRKGQMRKELRMLRWRRLFKFSFKATVDKIQRMKAQGW